MSWRNRENIGVPFTIFIGGTAPNESHVLSSVGLYCHRRAAVHPKHYVISAGNAVAHIEIEDYAGTANFLSLVAIVLKSLIIACFWARRASSSGARKIDDG
jgi:hypothetical protein